jgi:hypothetical protein
MDNITDNINPRLVIPSDVNPCKDCLVLSCCSRICEEGIRKVLQDMATKSKENMVFVDYNDLITKD